MFLRGGGRIDCTAYETESKENHSLPILIGCDIAIKIPKGKCTSIVIDSIKTDEIRWIMNSLMEVYINTNDIMLILVTEPKTGEQKIPDVLPVDQMATEP